MNPNMLGTDGSAWRTVIFKQTSGSAMGYALYANNGSARPHRPGQHRRREERRGHCTTPIERMDAPRRRPMTAREPEKLYVNGTLAHDARSDRLPRDRPPAPYGSAATASGASTSAASIDDVRVYNRALSATEVGTDMTTPVGGTAPPPDTTPPAAPSPPLPAVR